MGGAKAWPSFWVPEPRILRGEGKAGSTVKCKVKFPGHPFSEKTAPLREENSQIESHRSSTFTSRADFLQPSRKYFPHVPEGTGEGRAGGGGGGRLPQSQPAGLHAAASHPGAQATGYTVHVREIGV